MQRDRFQRIVITFTAIIATSFLCIASSLLALSVLAGFIVVYGLVFDKESITHPVYVISGLVGFYFIFGSLNISTYRGEISEHTCLLEYMFLCSMIIGVLIYDIKPNEHAPIHLKVPNLLLILAGLPAFVGLLWIGLSPGFPLFDPNLFTKVRGKAYFLSETIFVLFVLVINNIYLKEFSKIKRALIIAGLLFFISLPGYRGWPIIAILCLCLLSLRYRQKKLFTTLAMYSVLVLGLITGLAYYRRLHSDELILAELVVQKFDAEQLGVFGALLHFALRESIAISQFLIERYQQNVREIHGSLFLSDFMTMFPGSRDSGGIMIASIFGEYSGVGLTPGALGALIYEFGTINTFFIAMLIGIILSYFYKISLKYAVPGYSCLYYLIIIYIIHYIHRGIPKPSYLTNPLLIIFLLTLSKQLSKNIKHLKDIK
ncbi:hypothetical protein KVP06_09320 [Geobacter sulfurreducens]|nr:hypothetical protein [Geobacter sulfurreducens]UAC02594.1 hypothetical protein KVP06_09320 [Geobacter sulfurreducens]